MSDRSHEAGALFEFDLDRRSEAKIWIKHRGTGHTYQFALSDDRSGLRNEFTIVPEQTGGAATRLARLLASTNH